MEHKLTNLNEVPQKSRRHSRRSFIKGPPHQLPSFLWCLRQQNSNSLLHRRYLQHLHAPRSV
uniref:Uncharacterized protein n=1 Tax=Salix viminalis TaxID=40686 RepID=A0A6N2N0Q2_SALVM